MDKEDKIEYYRKMQKSLVELNKVYRNKTHHMDNEKLVFKMIKQNEWEIKSISFKIKRLQNKKWWQMWKK